MDVHKSLEPRRLPTKRWTLLHEGLEELENMANDKFRPCENEARKTAFDKIMEDFKAAIARFWSYLMA